MKRNRLIHILVMLIAIIASFFSGCDIEFGREENEGEDMLLISDNEISCIRENYIIRNHISEVSNDYLQMTLSLATANNGIIAYQNGIVVPDFMPQERIKINLNGLWRKKRFEADYQFSLEPRSENWIEAAETEADNAHMLNYDDTSWEEKKLPAPENSMNGQESIQGIEPYESGVWYRRSFTLGNEFKEKQVFIKALGISYICDIWINGHWVGYHEGGFTPFAMDISPFLQFDTENIIFIRIDNPPWGKRFDTIPAVAGTDFFNYTGIIQDIYLEAVNDIFIPRADFVTKEIDGSLECGLIVSNYSTKSAKIVICREIFEADKSRYKESPSISGLINGETVFKEISYEEIDSQEDKRFLYKFKINEPKLWDVLDPNLYISKISILDNEGNLLDVFYTQFGIRTVKTDHTKILINGKNFFARGIARHEEWPLYGRTSSWERIVSDFDQMAAMNVNFIRTGHYPNHVYTYLYLDRLGIPSMSEIPLWQLESVHFKALNEKGLAVQMFREMVFSQYNSPSVILWSTQNECTGTVIRKEYNEILVNDIHSNYNDGRLLTQSAAADQGGPKDASMEPLDVNGWTMYFGTFHGGTAYNGTKSFLMKVKDYWDKPTICTEFGTWSSEGDVDSINQVQIYEKSYNALMEFANITPKGSYNENGILAGIDYWIMYDWYVNHNNWIDTFGIYHMDRENMKVVGNRIYDDYTMLKENHEEQLTFIDEYLITDNSIISNGQQIEIELSSGTDFMKYSYLHLNCEFSLSNAIVHVILEDIQGNKWDYYTDRVESEKTTNLVVPIYQMNGIEMKNIIRITLKYSKNQTVKINSIFLTS